MLAQITYRSLVYPFFSAISILSFSLYPMVSLAYPSLGNQCSSCHASIGGGQTGNTTRPTTTDSTETANTTPEQPVEEEVTETTNSTTEQPVEEDIVETTNSTTEQPVKEDTTTNTTTEQPITTGESSGSTTEERTTEQTTGTHNTQTTDLMTEFDINKDGQMTQDEVQVVQNDFFKTADTDANGYLTKEEFQTGGGLGKFSVCQPNFVRLDNNLDQLISQDEFVNNVPLFDKLDLDNNGIVTVEELNLRNLYDYGMSYGKLHGMGYGKGHRGLMNQKGSKGSKHHSH